MLLFYGHFVVAMLLPAGVNRRGSEPGVGVNVERSERVGNRRGGDVRGVAFAGFGGAASASDLFRAVGIFDLLRAVVLAAECSLL